MTQNINKNITSAIAAKRERKFMGYVATIAVRNGHPLRIELERISEM